MPTVNPVLVQDQAFHKTLYPASNINETFILVRKYIKVDAELQGFGKLRGCGSLFLTSQRLVFIAESDQSRADFISLEVYLHEVTSPHFRQPIFGCNYLDLKTSVGSIYFYFYSGGAGTFLPAFFNIYETCLTAGGYSHVVHAIRTGQNIAFVDPNDPCVFFVTQPRMKLEE